MYSLRHPPAGLTLIHQLLWPLIFAQLAALKNWVRAHHGRGIPYGYVVSRWGRVTLTYVGARPFTSYSASVTFAPTRFDFSLGFAVCSAPDAAPCVPAPHAVQQASSVHSCFPPHHDTS